MCMKRERECVCVRERESLFVACVQVCMLFVCVCWYVRDMSRVRGLAGMLIYIISVCLDL